MKRYSFGASSLSAQADKALELAGNGNEAVHRLAVADALHLDDDRQSLVENERERVGRIDGDWRQNREDVRQEQAVQPLALGRAELLGLENFEVGLGQLSL